MEDWKEGIDEDVLKVVDRFCEDSDDGRRLNEAKIAKGYYELNKKFSSSPKIPADDAPPEKWNDFYNKLGRPENPDGYELKKDSLPEDYPWDEDFEKSMKQIAHEAGVNSKQFEAMANAFMEYNGTSFKSAQEASQKAVETALGELKDGWKDDFEKNVNIAKHAVAAVDDKDETIKKYLDSTGLGDDPVFIKLFHSIGLKILDDSLVQGIQTPEAGQTSQKGQFEPEFAERYGSGENA